MYKLVGIVHECVPPATPCKTVNVLFPNVADTLCVQLATALVITITAVSPMFAVVHDIEEALGIVVNAKSPPTSADMP